MAQQDWRDALAGLAAGLPDDDKDAVAEAAEDSSDGGATQTTPVHIALERKGRGGKTATIIFGLTIGDDALRDLAADLKRSLGTGGSARGGEILIQGDRVDDCRKLLISRGYKIK